MQRQATRNLGSTHGRQRAIQNAVRSEKPMSEAEFSLMRNSEVEQKQEQKEEVHVAVGQVVQDTREQR